MVIKTKKGFFEVLKNVRDALNIEKFEEAYLEEYYDAYDYIVGDIASDILRLKGFKKNDGSYKKIPDYLSESCVYKCAFYILRRLNEKEYTSLFEYYKTNPNKDLTVGDDKVPQIEKVNYDKENLVLESTNGNNPNIVLDMQRINRIKTFSLPKDLENDKEDNKDIKKSSKNDSRKDKFADKKSPKNDNFKHGNRQKGGNYNGR